MPELLAFQYLLFLGFSRFTTLEVKIVAVRSLEQRIQGSEVVECGEIAKLRTVEKTISFYKSAVW